MINSTTKRSMYICFVLCSLFFISSCHQTSQPLDPIHELFTPSSKRRGEEHGVILISSVVSSECHNEVLEIYDVTNCSAFVMDAERSRIPVGFLT